MRTEGPVMNYIVEMVAFFEISTVSCMVGLILV
jgi:hypothetical protein